MPEETPLSGSCDVRLAGNHNEKVYVWCDTHPAVKEKYVDTPSEAWAWEQQHRREVSGGRDVSYGTLCVPE
jgi:hypothetical protein